MIGSHRITAANTKLRYDFTIRRNITIIRGDSHPSDYIESRDYFSWERFFTALLTGQTKDTYLCYSETKLNPVYLNKNISDKITAQIPQLSDGS